jgi:uncharacterized membrane protein
LSPTTASATTVSGPAIPSSASALGRRAVPLCESILLGAATILMGLMAGFFYAYACSVMIGLRRTDDRTFVSSMQWINATVRNAGFAPSFFGALLLTASAAVVVFVRRRPGRWLIASACLLYAAAFALTMAISVPLNNQLADAGLPSEPGQLAAVRAQFENTWVRWNLVRTILSTCALAVLVVAITVRRNGHSAAGRAGARSS